MAETKKTLWIDLDNSPHVLFFDPIIKELTNLNYDLFITARDSYQVYELADLHGIDCLKIGRHYGKNKTAKFFGTLYRSAQFYKYLRYSKPSLAISHGSRSQLLISKLLKIRTICFADYEYTKRHKWLSPQIRIIPEIIPKSHYIGKKTEVLSYPGIKENVYLPFFNPDPKFLTNHNIDSDRVLITVRPPATEAHYHSKNSEILFVKALRFLSIQKNTQIYVLPRTKYQNSFISKTLFEEIHKKTIILVDHAIDGLNLIWHSDLVLSGGGTMNREAASLGVPVYSIFLGKIGAVDSYLYKNNLLTFLKTEKDFSKISIEKRNLTNTLLNNRSSFDAVIKYIRTFA